MCSGAAFVYRVDKEELDSALSSSTTATKTYNYNYTKVNSSNIFY